MDKNNSKIVFFIVFAGCLLFGAIKYQNYLNEHSPKAIRKRLKEIEQHKKDSIEAYKSKVKNRLFKLTDEVHGIINGINNGYVNDGNVHFSNNMNTYNFHISNVSFVVRQNNIYAVCPGRCIKYLSSDYHRNAIDTNAVLICGYSDVTYKILNEFKELKEKEMSF